jgi:hypothetical protein
MEHLETSNQPEYHRVELEDFPEVNLRALNPKDLVTLWESLREEDSEELLDYDNDERGKLYAALERGKESIPGQDKEFGLVLMEELASRWDWISRHIAIEMLPALTRINHDAGINLWNKLVRDVNEENRRDALYLSNVRLVPRETDGEEPLWHEHETMFAPEEYELGIESFEVQGISPGDARHLHEIFLAAAAGEIELYDPMNEMLKRLKGSS